MFIFYTKDLMMKHQKSLGDFGTIRWAIQKNLPAVLGRDSIIDFRSDQEDLLHQTYNNNNNNNKIKVLLALDFCVLTIMRLG